MKMNLKKAAALMLACILMLGCTSAWAEETLSVILNAGTTQAFSDEAVKEEDLNSILEAGLSAASAINQQPWYFAVVTNQEVMDELSGGAGFSGAPAGMPAGELPEGMETPPSGMPEGFEGAEGKMPEGMPEGFSGAPGAGAGAMPEGMTAPAASGSAKAALGDSPVAVIIYMNENTSSPNASFDCGLACQNMVIAANALGYGTKIISSPTMTLNGENHDALCEKLGVDVSLNAVAVLLIGVPDTAVDGATGASERSAMEEKVSFVE